MDFVISKAVFGLGEDRSMMNELGLRVLKGKKLKSGKTNDMQYKGVDVFKKHDNTGVGICSLLPINSGRFSCDCCLF